MPQVLNNYKSGIDWTTARYCGRGTPYGNPFRIGWADVDGTPMTRDRVCDRFEAEILPTLDVSHLRGFDLVCFCAPRRCHCDAILKKANALPYCPFCKKEHEGGDTCMGHYP